VLQGTNGNFLPGRRQSHFASRQLFVENKGTGRIGMYLVSRNGTDVDLCYTFVLLNSKSKTRNVVKSEASSQNKKLISGTGHRSHFRVGECLGSSSFASIESIRDRRKGFIDGDSFTLRVEMRVMLPENEGKSFFALPHSGTYTVRGYLRGRVLDLAI